jgi:hypothetical protein
MWAKFKFEERLQKKVETWMNFTFRIVWVLYEILKKI